MSDQYPVLIVVAPLLAALLASGAGWINRRLCFPVALAGLGVAAASALGLLFKVLDSGPVLYKLAGWDPPMGIAYYVDNLNALVLVVVSLAAVINLVGSRRAIEEEFEDKSGAFYTLYVLATTGLMGMVVTGDAFNLYVLLEIASLTGYALIGLGNKRAPFASLNYVLMGTIGASFYLLGVGYLYILTGTLNMADLARLIPALGNSTSLMAAFAIMMVGLWLKMAFFPLHAWLPNAYTYAPSASSSLLAPLMTKVMIYVMIRMMISVFGLEYVFETLSVADFVVWVAVAAIVVGAFMALTQRNFKKMLAYIVVAEVGYMVGGAWLGNRIAMQGAILHIVNDAAMTLCVFMVAGNIMYKMHGVEFKDLRGLFRSMPWTMSGLVVGALSIIGVPPTCGFFSKWYLLRGALAADHWGFLIALIFSSLVNVVLFFRIFEIAYFDSSAEPHGDHGHDDHGHSHGPAPEPWAEAPWSMVVPLLLVAASLIILGVYAGDLVDVIINPVIPKGLV